MPQAMPFDDTSMSAKVSREVVALYISEENSLLVFGVLPHATRRVEVAVGLQKLVRKILRRQVWLCGWSI
jgi:hypothetical protein